MYTTFVNLLGLCGNLGFGASCLPMAWKAFRTGKNMGIPASSIWLFLFALTTFYGYLLLHYGFDPFTSIIGFVEVFCWATVGRYHYFPRGEKYVFQQRTRCALGYGDPCGPDDQVSCDCDSLNLP